MNTLQVISMQTPDGEFRIILDDKNIARASGFGELVDLIKRLPQDLQMLSMEAVENHPYENFINAYYNGDDHALDMIPRSQTGSDFQKAVWKAISDIPFGKTISYKELAVASKNPTAIRAAGTICGLNKLILLVPCHRVLKSDGSIGSYLYGSAIKASLLHRENDVTRYR